MTGVCALVISAVISFTSPRTFRSGDLAGTALIADFNRDGIPDVAVYGSGVTVMLGKVDATLGAPNRLLSGGIGQYAALGDFNGDGQLDIVATAPGSLTSAEIDVLPGRGDGTFGAAIKSTSTKPLHCMIAADLDGDGKLDLAAGNGQAGTIAVLNGRGDGTFGPPTYYESDQESFLVAAGDFDRDGHADLAVQAYGASGGTGSIALYRNAGNGTLQARRTIASGGAFRALEMADVDGNGVPDLITGSYGESTALVLLARGDRTFDRREVALAGIFIDVTAADVDGNGTADLIVHEEIAGAFFQEIFANDGAASWHQAARFLLVGRRPALADLDRDGKPDLIMPRPASGFSSGSTVAVARGLGDGKFVSVPVIQGDFQSVAAGQSRGHTVSAADVTGDGKADLIATNNNDTFSVFAGKGDGTFAAAHAYPLTAAKLIRTADVNGDGKLDLFLARQSPPSASILINQGNADFSPPLDISLPTFWNDLKIADLNGDGRPDLIISLPQSAHVALQLANGTFAPDITLPVELTNEYTALAVDVDRDGKMDVVAFGDATGSGCANVFRGKGDGTFFPMQWITGFTRTFTVDSGDLNRDGLADFVTTNFNFSGADVTVWLANGNGNYTQQRYAIIGAPSAAALADIDGDGDLDVIVANRVTGEIAVYPGNGDGTLAAPLTFVAVPNANSLGVADFNGDGKVDAAVGGSLDNVIAVLTNESVIAPKRHRAVR